jgi:hypothetical protein
LGYLYRYSVSFKSCGVSACCEDVYALVRIWHSESVVERSWGDMRPHNRVCRYATGSELLLLSQDRLREWKEILVCLLWSLIEVVMVGVRMSDLKAHPVEGDCAGKSVMRRI